MSRYSSGGDYRSSNGGGDHRGGYTGGYRSGGGYPYGKINEDDVPESQHSIFVRGLPSSITYDEIKHFFEDHIGPCSFDFQKVNYERQSLFVAVRFESKDHAKEAYNKYREADIMGVRCEVTWFRDIRRYISYQQQNGGTIRRGNFGRGAGRYQSNGGSTRGDYRKRRYSDDRRSHSRSYSDDSDRSRSRSRRSSRSRSSRSRSRSEGERSTSRESDRRRSVSKDEKRRKKEKKSKKSKKERRSRRSESGSSGGERSRSSSRSERGRSDSRGGGRVKKSKNGRSDRDGSASSNHSPLRMTPPPPAPTIIGPVIPVAGAALPPPAATTTLTNPVPIEKPVPLRITIANKTVPVENTSFKMALDTDEPPRKIVRGPMTPPPREEDMEVEEKEEEEVMLLRKEQPVAADPKEKGGWRSVGGDNSGPPSDVIVENGAKGNGEKAPHVNGFDMVPRSVGGATSGTNVASPAGPPPPKRLPLPGSMSTGPPPPGRPAGGGVSAAMAAKFPEMTKVIREIKGTQDALVASIRPNALRLSDLSSGESVMEKMEERERQIGELDAGQKTRFALKMKQITNSYKGDASTITTVIKSVVQKDPTLEDQIKPALLAVLEDLEKQIYKKVDDFLICGM